MSKSNDAVIHAFNRGYRINPYGALLNPKGERVKGSKNPLGYIKTSIKMGGVRVSYFVHRLAAYQKFGDKMFGDGIQVRHLDGDASNFALYNIEIGTAKQNAGDKKPEITAKAVEAAAKARRSSLPEEVRDLREKRAQGWSYSQLCDFFSLTKSTVSYIVNRKTYNWVD